MDPRAGWPGLQPPASGDRASLTWSAELGPASRLDRLSLYLDDLGAVVDLGERWGSVIARHNEQRQLLYRISREGARFIEQEVTQLGYRTRDVLALDEWLEIGFFRPRPGRFRFADPADLLATLADARSLRSMGSPTDVVRITYRNPIEVILGGSGFLLLGVVYALRFVRDWSHSRRVGAAQATQAEHDARRAGAHADYSEWLVNEARRGRLYVPPHELVNLVTKSDVRAIDRLAESDIRLELPAGTDAPDEGAQAE